MSKPKKNAADKALLQELMQKMMLCRKFEEKVQWLFAQGLVHGTTHLGIGEEGVAVGAMTALETEDYMLATHRGHNTALAKGTDVNAMMAEILAKKTGVCKGKGGSMHIADLDKGVLGANGILGANGPLACGAGLTIRKKGLKRVCVCMLGDGASNLGAVHESMNLASVWNLPVIFLLINNTYGMSTPISKATKDINLVKRAIPYSMKAYAIDGNDVELVYHTMKEARQYAIENGPVFIVADSYRTSGHSKSDGNLYRTKEEIAEWRDKAPIKRLTEKVLAAGIFTQDEIDAMEKKAEATIEAAVEYGKSSPEPDVEDLLVDVYA